ncbi:DUF1778 domain-containing protein [Acidimicrobiaceae bacterium USS-CC1]|uniref:DUF1778 domain-containing protein n=1 Tax=Acidiferrimicrobium australe TaxID=2664430 RepID=A0ABW9QUB6_9ACTN|nr:DUF1778 domain-containing protein [Acidiferrimicrobium australe]
MSAKSRRREMRADPDAEQTIAAAARLGHQSVSAFVLGAALAEADRVLARREVTLMAAEQFDALASSLEAAEPAPKLAQVAERTRSFDRR